MRSTITSCTGEGGRESAARRHKGRQHITCSTSRRRNDDGDTLRLFAANDAAVATSFGAAFDEIFKQRHAGNR